MQDYGNGAEEAENRIAEEEYEIWENRDQYGIEW